ncbi:MAG: DEAD/DEAH box helicase [Candidatus Cloacimonadota bacterium]|nr:MAG: DEAD/DEAH box helicase [Candidatus Cloacimonadota bacterium]
MQNYTEIDNFIDTISRDPQLNMRVSHIEVIKEKEAEFFDFPSDLDETLSLALRNSGIEQLYSHQVKSYSLLKEGKNVVIVTPTASGKTLCYNIPVINAILKDETARALYLFPTKALSYDQLEGLERLLNALKKGIASFTYDGDTPKDIRKSVREKSRIVLSNPDMLHKAILPHHTKWNGLFSNLRFIVIDELHNYRGIFGSQVANVIRRLKRISRHYGSSPQFILSSATIANPAELAGRLIEEEVELINKSGSPQGRKYFILWNPPLVDRELGLRRNYISEAQLATEKLMKLRIQVILFARSRLNVEILTSRLKEKFEKNPKIIGKIRGYRGGYLPNERREIEQALRDGEARVVVSTNALELGIDIGSLDGAILAGYPGSIASTWQQAGRAGRKEKSSIAILVASSEPLNQFLINHPQYLFGESPEKGLINPDNLLILIAHIKCAAFELPFREGEQFGKEPLDEVLSYLEEKGVLHKSGSQWFWTEDSYPADTFGLRNIPGENFIIVDRTGGKARSIGEVDYASAPMLLHEKAIYIHSGEQYHVDKLDFVERKVYVRKVTVNYYTDAIEYTKVKVLDNFDTKDEVNWGEVCVTKRVVGYKKIKLSTFENIGFGDVNLPENEMHTTCYWFTINRERLKNLGFTDEAIIYGLYGISYIVGNIAPLFLLCSRMDIGVHLGDKEGLWSFQGDVIKKDRQAIDEIKKRLYLPTIFIYENYPGGVGFAYELFSIHPELLQRALDEIKSCSCNTGCPSCIGPSFITNINIKEISLGILDEILQKNTIEG